jgi:serine/threonine protein kinase
MAPEQARGEAERIDPRTDLFGLGGVLYRLLTGRPPHEADNPDALWEAARAGEVVPPRQLNAGIPAAVNDFCMRCLARHPGNRFASAAELVQAIRRCQRRPWWTGRAGVLVGSATAALVLVALAIWYFNTGSEDNADTPVARAPKDDGGSTRKNDGSAVRPVKPIARHPNGRKLRQDFPVLVQVIDQQPDAHGRYSITEGARIRFRIQVPTSSYVAVWHYDDEGNVIQLFPNAQIDRTHLIRARQWQEIPSNDRYAFAASASKKREYLHVVASTKPWDPPASGLRGTGKDNSFLVVDPQEVDQLTRGLTQVRVEKVAEAVLAFRVVPAE